MILSSGVLALKFLGPKTLPELGRIVGQALAEFRRPRKSPLGPLCRWSAMTGSEPPSPETVHDSGRWYDEWRILLEDEIRWVP